MGERGDAIVLIGFSGSGKSSVGRELAARTGLRCYDIDEMVSAQSRQTIVEIFEERGEEGFRALETEALRTVPF
ncbi:MAG: shikimate kinase, partial [Verrucomicrobiota bacterium]|nr:shikimate kinase [Verrucomicrobiota bacterium]